MNDKMEQANSNMNIKGNIFGGLTAGVIALPLALAFGAASGLGAAAGLYGAILVCLFATLFEGTPTQISGPTGPMTVVIASIATSYSGNFKIVFMTIMLASWISFSLAADTDFAVLPSASRSL